MKKSDESPVMQAPTQEQVYKGFVGRIKQALGRLADDMIDLFGLCRDFERSGSWQYSGLPFDRVLAAHGVAFNKYQAFCKVEDLFGRPAVKRLGIAGSVALYGWFMPVDATGETGVAKDLYEAVCSDLLIYESTHQMPPSDRFVIDAVRAQAQAMGIVRPTAPGPKDVAGVAIRALQVIADLKGEPTSSKIASDTLDQLLSVGPKAEPPEKVVARAQKQ